MVLEVLIRRDSMVRRERLEGDWHDPTEVDPGAALGEGHPPTPWSAAAPPMVSAIVGILSAAQAS